MAYATVDELAAALRVRVTAENTPGLQACLDAAAAEIDHDIDLIPSDLAAASYRWSVLTAAADPGEGWLRFDRTTAAATTALYLDGVDMDGQDLTDRLLTSTTDDLVRLTDNVDPFAWEEFTVTGPAVDEVGWVRLPVDRSSTGQHPLALVDGLPLRVSALRPNVVAKRLLSLVHRVNLVRAVEWWKANDAAFGVIGFDQTGALQAPRDGFNRHAYTLTPAKRRWGIA